MDARLEAAERILDRGVRFRLPAPFYLRWLHKDKIDIRSLNGGTILEIARIVVANELETAIEKQDWKMLKQSIEPVSQCVAITILGTKDGIEKELETRKLTDKLLWKIPASELVKMFRVIISQNRISDFTNITRFLVHQTRMMTSPKNLGQEISGD